MKCVKMGRLVVDLGTSVCGDSIVDVGLVLLNWSDMAYENIRDKLNIGL